MSRHTTEHLTQESKRSSASPVDAFLAAVTGASIPDCEAWTEDAVLSATVPNWRFHRRTRRITSTCWIWRAGGSYATLWCAVAAGRRPCWPRWRRAMTSPTAVLSVVTDTPIVVVPTSNGGLLAPALT